MATNYLLIKKYDLALEYFDKVIRGSHSQNMIENSYSEKWAIYLRLELVQKAAGVLEEYLGQGQMRQYRQDAIYKLAEIYRTRMNDPFRAASLYHTYITDYKNSNQAADALYYAGLCYRAINDIGNSNYHFQAYMDKFPNGPLADSIRQITAHP